MNDMGKETWEDECVFILFFSVTVKALRSQTTKVPKHDKIIKKKNKSKAPNTWYSSDPS